MGTQSDPLGPIVQEIQRYLTGEHGQIEVEPTPSGRGARASVRWGVHSLSPLKRGIRANAQMHGITVLPREGDATGEGGSLTDVGRVAIEITVPPGFRPPQISYAGGGFDMPSLSDPGSDAPRDDVRDACKPRLHECVRDAYEHALEKLGL